MFVALFTSEDWIIFAIKFLILMPQHIIVNRGVSFKDGNKIIWICSCVPPEKHLFRLVKMENQQTSSSQDRSCKSSSVRMRDRFAVLGHKDSSKPAHVSFRELWSSLYLQQCLAFHFVTHQALLPPLKNDTRLCLPHIPCPASIYSQDVTVQTISHIIPTLKLSLKLRPHSKTSVTVTFAKTFAVFAGNERLCKVGKALALLLLCLCSPTSLIRSPIHSNLHLPGILIHWSFQTSFTPSDFRDI